jgi:hypothetical protein
MNGQVCDIGSHTCRQPCMNGACTRGVCDPTSNACVQCLAATDCPQGVCDTANHTCVGCLVNMDCANVAGRPLCDPVGHRCVACATDSDCTSPDVCDSASHTCQPPGDRALCAPCEQDSQCAGMGSLCIGLRAGGTARVDTSCSTACNVMTATACPSGFACTSVRQGSAHVCRPSYPMPQATCTAMRNINTNCTVPMTMFAPSGCGVAMARDSLCVATASGATTGFCSFSCQTSSDCPLGTACSTVSGSLVCH